MLIVSHEEEVVIVFSQFPDIIILIVGHDILREVEIIAMEGIGELTDKGRERAVVVIRQFLKVEVQSGEMVLLTEREEILDQRFRATGIMQDLLNTLRTELTVPGIREHRHDRHTGTAHQRQAFAVDLRLYLQRLRIEEEPLGKDEVHLRDALLQGRVRLWIPRDIEAGTDTGGHLRPTVDILIFRRAFLSGKAVILPDMLLLPFRIVVVGFLRRKELSEAFILLSQLVMPHERLVGREGTAETVVERKSRGTVYKEHRDKHDYQQHDDREQGADSELKSVPA